MVKKKPQSKRIPARKKYKIEKKVREHRRKLKKQEKLAGKKKSRLRKDPGIPNLYPFKEHVLKQLQEKKEEETQRRQKEARRRQQAKKRNLQQLRTDAEKRTKAFEKHNKGKTTDKGDELRHQGGRNNVKSYYKEFKKVVDNADVMLEILDARDPLGCRCLQMEQAILASGSNKKLILVLNKIDLVPRDNVKMWLKYLRNEFPTVAFKSSTQTQKHNLSCKKFPLGSGPVSMETSSACLGSETLLKMLGNYSRSKDMKMSITVGVVGLPNVGKSSIINSLKRNRACTVGATPGVTKVMQRVQLDTHISLLDSPGVVLIDKIGSDPSRMALQNCLKVECLPDVIAPLESILKRCSKMEVMKHYCIPSYNDTMEFATLLAKRMGKLRKGGVPNVEAAAKAVLHDWNNGRINYYTHPPSDRSTGVHVSAEIVQQWSRAFDMPSVAGKDDDILGALSEKLENALVMEHSQPIQEMEVPSDEEESEADDLEATDDEEMCSSDEESDDCSDDEEMDEDIQETLVVSMKSKKQKSSLNDDYDFTEHF